MDNIKSAGDPIPVSDDEESTDSLDSNIDTDDVQPNFKNSQLSSGFIVNDNNGNSEKNGASPIYSNFDNIDNVSLENAENKDIVQHDSNNDNKKEIISDNDDEEEYNNGENHQLNLYENVYNKQNNDIENVSASPSTSPKDIVDDISIAKEMSEVNFYYN